MRKLSISMVLMVLAVAGGIIQAQEPPPLPDGVQVVATGFNGPQGVLVDPDGNIWVIDSGIAGDQDVEYPNLETGELATTKMGNSAQIVRVAADGTQTPIAILPSLMASETEFAGGGRLALLDGTLYATSGAWAGNGENERPDLLASVVSIAEDGTVTEVVTTWDNEFTNNPDGTLIDTHPYGLTVGPDGLLYIADAGGNDLLRVDPMAGTVETVVAFDGLPANTPNPARNGANEADPVPTAVVFDDAGNAYVSFLSGAPFIPGTAKVVMVAPDGTVSDYAIGLTMLTDMRRGPDGELYAVQLGFFGEQGPDPTSGAIIRIHEGDDSEIVLTGLPFPTSLDFDADGNAYVTIGGVGAPGSGALVRIDGLTGMPGQALPAVSEPAAGETPEAE
jgi:sugar lactone lactonase YvrE